MHPRRLQRREIETMATQHRRESCHRTGAERTFTVVKHPALRRFSRPLWSYNIHRIKSFADAQQFLDFAAELYKFRQRACRPASDLLIPFVCRLKKSGQVAETLFGVFVRVRIFP